MATTQPFSDDGTALVLYRSRQLSEVTTVSTVAELIAAVSDGTVDKIVVAPGTYEFGSDMAGGDPAARVLVLEERWPVLREDLVVESGKSSTWA